MKLNKILQEVLSELNVPRPEDAYKFYKITKKDLGYGTMYTYVYENVNGDLMEISNMVTKSPSDPGKSIYIAFKKHDPDEPDGEEYDNEEEQEKKYSEKTGAQDLIKVLATVVQATKNTMNKEGGDKSIYAIKFSPADKKRASIYMHYIGTLFPDFKEKGQEGVFTSFVNKNFKPKVMSEIGDASNVETYKYSKNEVGADYDEEVYKMNFTTESDTNYVVVIHKIDRNEDGNWRMDLEFGVENESEGGLPPSYDYKSVVNKGEMYKVMATVVQITKKEVEISKQRNQSIKMIRIEPSKNFENDTRRANLYMAYIKKHMPKGSRVEVSPDLKQIEIILPKQN